MIDQATCLGFPAYLPVVIHRLKLKFQVDIRKKPMRNEDPDRLILLLLRMITHSPYN